MVTSSKRAYAIPRSAVPRATPTVMKSLGKKTEWSRLSGLAHSTPLCYTPITLVVEAGKLKPTFERLPYTLGNQVTSRDTCSAWKVAVRQRPPVLLFL